MQFECSKRDALYFVFFLLLYETSAYIANDMIMPGMLNVVRSFAASDNMVSTSLSAFILGGASLQIFLGPISDRYGRRPVMIFGVGLFLISTILLAIASSISWFIIMRFFQGMGLCFIMVVGYAALQEIFEEIYVIRLMGIMNNVTILAPLMGPLLGSFILLSFDWPIIFWLIAICAAIAMIGIWLYMPETVGTKRLDGSISPTTPLLFKVVKNNYCQLCKNQRFIFGSLALGLATVPIIAWIGTSPLILIKSAKLPIVTYGLLQAPIFLAAILGNVVMRFYTYKIPLLTIINYGAWIILMSLVLMSFFVFFSHHYIGLIVGISLYSYGLGLISAPLNRLTLYSTLIPKGTASALVSMILMILTAIGNQLSGFVYITKNNFYFSIFCSTCGICFFLVCLYFQSVSYPKEASA